MGYETWASAERVCVIGAGTMGSGIAAHLANIGFDVTLLDTTRESVATAFDRAKSAKPSHFFLPETANKIRIGSIDENFEWLIEADWVCEAIVEKLDVKRELFARLENVIRHDAMISTNTSGLQIGLLAEGRSESFKKRFVGTHFFNPPRYLKLLELIPTQDTDPEALSAIASFLEDRCARRVVPAKDTPGFIANRYGMWSMFHAIHVAERLHLSVEQVDAITGPFIGRPRSASFRLNDIVGLDVMQDIANNLLARCPDDASRASLEAPKSLKHLLEKGWIGEKAGQGYYRREGREFLALDLTTFAYRQRQETKFQSLEDLGKQSLGDRVRAALDLKDEAGEYLRHYLIPTLQYADRLKEEISHNVQDFDRVMKWGFGWEMGPFEMIDAIGSEKLGLGKKRFYNGTEMADFSGNFVPIKAEPQYRGIQDFPIDSRYETFVVRDLGDGVGAISTTTKQGVISPALVDELLHFLDGPKFGRFVLTSEAKNFSVGFDLNVFLQAIAAVDVAGIESALKTLHHLGEALEKRIVVAAVQGYCLGAGLELAHSCSRIVALSDSQIGLPESKVGLIPGGRGTVLMRLYNGPQAKVLAETALSLTEGRVSANADEARELRLIRSTDITCYHPDRLIAEAKKEALRAAPVSRPVWKPIEGPLTGMIDRLMEQARSKGTITEYDESIGQKIKSVFSKTESYEDACERERTEFAELCFRALSQARIRHMLENGKPLRN